MAAWTVLAFGAVYAQDIQTAAGTGTAGYSGDGMTATSAAINSPNGVAVDSSDNLYIADFENARIRVVNTSGVIETYAGARGRVLRRWNTCDDCNPRSTKGNRG